MGTQIAVSLCVHEQPPLKRACNLAAMSAGQQSAECIVLSHAVKCTIIIARRSGTQDGGVIVESLFVCACFRSSWATRVVLRPLVWMQFVLLLFHSVELLDSEDEIAEIISGLLEDQKTG